MDVFNLGLERSRRGAAGDRADRAARLAESVACAFDRLAGTYRRMADYTDSPDKATRLRGYITRLEHRADRERAEARRFRTRVEPRSGD